MLQIFPPACEALRDMCLLSLGAFSVARLEKLDFEVSSCERNVAGLRGSIVVCCIDTKGYENVTFPK